MRRLTQQTKSPVRCIYAIVVLAALVTCFASASFATTWYIEVGGTGDAPTIQAGVDSAATGDTVRVGPGAFVDTTHLWIDGELAAVNVHLDKDISLIGSGPGATVLGNADTDVVIYVENVGAGGLIKGFKMETRSGGWGCIDGPQPAAGPYKTAIKCCASELTIAENEIVDNENGVELDGSDVSLVENDIHNCNVSLSVWNGSDAEIRSNRIFFCGAAIDCRNSSPTVVANECFDFCWSLGFSSGSFPYIAENYLHDQYHYEYSALIQCEGDAVIENNRLVGSYYGVYAYGETTVPRVIRGNVLLYSTFAIVSLTSESVIENNTIDRAYWALSGAGSKTTIRNNIVTRATIGIGCDPADMPVVTCNDLFDIQTPYSHNCPDQTGLNGNIAVDPEFCGIDDSGNYFLQSDSPCLPGNHPGGVECGLIGALGVNCATVPTEKTTWGSVKSRFR